MPKISVIIPVYNVENYLNRCVDSVLSQSFADFELILVDDGSPDNCGAICDDYAKKDRRITVIHKQNGGLSSARNAGIDLALEKGNSEWITFIDSDDWVHKDYLKILYEAAIINGANVSVCSFLRTDGKTENADVTAQSSRVISPETLWKEKPVNAVVAWGKLYKTEIWKSGIRFPFGKTYEDEFTTYKILFAENRIAITDCALYFYFCNTQGIMNSALTPRKLEMKIDALSEQADFFASYSELSAFSLHRLFESGICHYMRQYYGKSEYAESYKYLKKRLKKELKKRKKQIKSAKKSVAWIHIATINENDGAFFNQLRLKYYVLMHKLATKFGYR